MSNPLRQLPAKPHIFMRFGQWVCQRRELTFVIVASTPAAAYWQSYGAWQRQLGWGDSPGRRDASACPMGFR